MSLRNAATPPPRCHTMRREVSATPGPWHWHVSRTQQHLHDKGGNSFAQVSMPRPSNLEQGMVAQYEANARLIAVAPELLQLARRLADPSTDVVNLRILARVLTDKAEGRS